LREIIKNFLIRSKKILKKEETQLQMKNTKGSPLKNYKLRFKRSTKSSKEATLPITIVKIFDLF
jgi:hypothetical protein